MVTILFRSFQDFKDFLIARGPDNPNRAGPTRFHSLAPNGNIQKIASVFVGGQAIAMYISQPQDEIKPDDPWLAANPELQYGPSILVHDIGEAIA